MRGRIDFQELPLTFIEQESILHVLAFIEIKNAELQPQSSSQWHDKPARTATRD